MASWREVGKFTSGPQRNHARFIEEAEKTSQGDGAHEKIIEWQKTSGSVARQNAMLETSSSDPEISRPFDLFLTD
jgi:hypothetical protein